MTSEYTDIYSRFFLRVKDYEMSGLDEKLVNEMLNGYLRSTVSKPMVRRLFQSISMDDDMEEIEYTLRESLDEDSDKDFVEEVLALGMVSEWASPKYHSTLLTSQLFSNSEQKLNRLAPTQFATLGNFVVYSFEYLGNSLEPKLDWITQREII